jgi:WD40 repeat protein
MLRCIWTAAAGSEVARLFHGGGVADGFQPDGKYVITSQDSSFVCMWLQARDRTYDSQCAVRSRLERMAGMWFGSNDQTARGDVANGEEVPHEPVRRKLSNQSDGRCVVSGAGIAARVGSHSREVTRLVHKDTVNWWTSAGWKICCFDYDRTVCVWGGYQAGARLLHDEDVILVLSSNGRYVVSASRDNIARVWMWRAARKSPDAP